MTLDKVLDSLKETRIRVDQSIKDGKLITGLELSKYMLSVLMRLTSEVIKLKNKA